MRRKGDSPGDSRFARDGRRIDDALYRPDGTVRQEITRAGGAGKGDAAGFYGGAAKIWFTRMGMGWIFWGWGIVGWMWGLYFLKRPISPSLGFCQIRII